MSILSSLRELIGVSNSCSILSKYLKYYNENNSKPFLFRNVKQLRINLLNKNSHKYRKKNIYVKKHIYDHLVRQ